MIRCIPVDGSPPFEVENDAIFERFLEDGTRLADSALRIAWMRASSTWTPACDSYPRVECRIESYRERAERLEHENVLLRLARDYCAVPYRDYNEVEPMTVTMVAYEAERDAIEKKIVALGHSLAEVQNL